MANEPKLSLEPAPSQRLWSFRYKRSSNPTTDSLIYASSPERAEQVARAFAYFENDRSHQGGRLKFISVAPAVIADESILSRYREALNAESAALEEQAKALKAS